MKRLAALILLLVLAVAYYTPPMACETDLDCEQMHGGQV